MMKLFLILMMLVHAKPAEVYYKNTKHTTARYKHKNSKRNGLILLFCGIAGALGISVVLYCRCNNDNINDLKVTAITHPYEDVVVDHAIQNVYFYSILVEYNDRIVALSLQAVLNRLLEKNYSDYKDTAEYDKCTDTYSYHQCETWNAYLTHTQVLMQSLETHHAFSEHQDKMCNVFCYWIGSLALQATPLVYKQYHDHHAKDESSAQKMIDLIMKKLDYELQDMHAEDSDSDEKITLSEQDKQALQALQSAYNTADMKNICIVSVYTSKSDNSDEYYQYYISMEYKGTIKYLDFTSLITLTCQGFYSIRPVFYDITDESTYHTCKTWSKCLKQHLSLIKEWLEKEKSNLSSTDYTDKEELAVFKKLEVYLHYYELFLKSLKFKDCKMHISCDYQSFNDFRDIFRKYLEDSIKK